MDLEKDPRPVESVALPMDPNDMRPERRVARLPEVEDVVVIYTLDPILGEIDIDDVGNDYLYPPKG
ncbi:MAG: hypothetical protein JWO77_3722 [Ilumatobacteraceae bacterium]|nr:hypothetical protein [Ilumatobacteraceae bacterium]